MIDEERIIAEITNDYDVMIELALKGYINLGFEIKTMEKFIDYFVEKCYYIAIWIYTLFYHKFLGVSLLSLLVLVTFVAKRIFC